MIESIETADSAFPLKNRVKVMSVIALTAALFIGILGNYTLPVQIGALMKGLGLDAAQSGFLGSIEMGTLGITVLIISYFITSISLAKLAATGAVIVITGQLLTVISGNYSILLIARLLVGIGSGLAYGSCWAAVATFDEPERIFARGQALINVGFSILLWFLPGIMAYGGYKWVFLSLSISCLVMLPFVFQLPSIAVSEQTERKTSSINIKVVFFHFFGITLLSLGQGSLWSFAERIGFNINLTANQVGTVLACSTIAMMFGSIFADFMGTRLGRFWPVIIGAALSGVTCITACYTTRYFTYFSAMAAFAFLYLYVLAYLCGISASIDPSGKIATATGGALLLSFSFGTGLGGFILAKSSYFAIGWFGLATCLASIIPFSISGVMIRKRGGIYSD